MFVLRRYLFYAKIHIIFYCTYHFSFFIANDKVGLFKNRVISYYNQQHLTMMPIVGSGCAHCGQSLSIIKE